MIGIKQSFLLVLDRFLKGVHHSHIRFQQIERYEQNTCIQS